MRLSPRPLLAGTAALLALGACVPAPEPTPAPAPAPAPTPAPTPAPAPPPLAGNWMDAPPTPGEWSYRATPGGSAAYYGPPESEAVFAISCSPEARIVELTAPGDSPPTVQIVVRTETRQATLNGQQSGELPSVRTTLPASDPLLDAMAFSKGRFAVQIGGLRTLYIPAYPEVTRVIEDCR